MSRNKEEESLCKNSEKTVQINNRIKLRCMPVLVGHRGMGTGKHRQENTVSAINKCGLFGRMAEIDVQLSMDKDVFVVHDLEMEGVPVEMISTNKLLGRVEMLSHALDSTDIDLNIEVKYEKYSIPVEVWCKAILDVVRRHKKPNRKIVYSSFSREVCEELKKTEETVLFLTEELTEESVEYSITNGYAGIVTKADEALKNAHIIDMIRQNSLHLATYGKTNNYIDKIDKQIEIGVHSIITDEIEDLSEYERLQTN